MLVSRTIFRWTYQDISMISSSHKVYQPHVDLRTSLHVRNIRDIFSRKIQFNSPSSFFAPGLFEVFFYIINICVLSPALLGVFTDFLSLRGCRHLEFLLGRSTWAQILCNKNMEQIRAQFTCCLFQAEPSIVEEKVRKLTKSCSDQCPC